MYVCERECVFLWVCERECVCVCVCVGVCVCVCVLTTKSVLICFDILLMSLGSKRQRKVIGERKKENFSYFLKTFFIFGKREKKSSNEIPICWLKQRPNGKKVCKMKSSRTHIQVAEKDFFPYLHEQSEKSKPPCYEKSWIYSITWLAFWQKHSSNTIHFSILFLKKCLTFFSFRVLWLHLTPLHS